MVLTEGRAHCESGIVPDKNTGEFVEIDTRNNEERSYAMARAKLQGWKCGFIPCVAYLWNTPHTRRRFPEKPMPKDRCWHIYPPYKSVP
ncbi:MAG: hypothetical protein WAW23_07770 [Candidatus Methanoperedens sp.]